MANQPCAFDGCVNDAWGDWTDLCQAHYKQQRAGKELKPLRRYRIRPPAPEGYAYCNECKNFKPLDAFFELPTGKPRPLCKVCHGQQSYYGVQRVLEGSLTT